MAKVPVNNLNVLSQDLLPTPQQVKNALPLTDKAQATVLQGRETVRRILDREDPRLFVVIGPCSIHDIKAAKEYAAHRNWGSNPPASASPPRWTI